MDSNPFASLDPKLAEKQKKEIGACPIINRWRDLNRLVAYFKWIARVRTIHSILNFRKGIPSKSLSRLSTQVKRSVPLINGVRRTVAAQLCNQILKA